MTVKWVRQEVDKDRKKHGLYDRYSTKQKYECVVLYKMVGNIAVISKQMGIPEHTIYNWRTLDWWKEIEEQIRTESRSKLGKNLQNLVDKAYATVEDRLDNGDYVYDQKLGKLVRKPVNANVAAGILKDSIDKTFLLEKLQKEEKKEINQEKITETLLKVAKEFEKFAKTKTVEAIVEPEGEDNALYDGGEARLPEGEPLIQIEAGADSRPGSSEQGPETLSEDGESSQGRQA